MKKNDIVTSHIVKAFLDIKAAKIMHTHGLYSHSIACCYYAVFHAIKAVNEAHDISAESHRQVMGQFNKQFVHPGKVGSFVSDTAYNLFERRNTTEYDPRELEGKDGSAHGIDLAKRAVDELIGFFHAANISFEHQSYSDLEGGGGE